MSSKFTKITAILTLTALIGGCYPSKNETSNVGNAEQSALSDNN